MTIKGHNPFAAFALDDWREFDTYRIKIHVAQLVGGAPKNEQMLAGWIAATNKELSDADRAALVNASKEELPDLQADKESKSSIGFKSDPEKGLFIEGRQVKAALKEAANVIKDIAPTGRTKEGKPEVGITAFKSKLAEQVFVEEDRIYLDRQKPDDVIERAIHVMTAQGPRNSLKRSEVVKDVTLSFTLRRRRGNVVPEVSLMAALKYGQSLGLGADRSQGFGVYEVVSIEKL